MYGIIKQLPVLGLAAALAVLAPRTVLAQETTHDSTAHAAPQDTGAVSGYEGVRRSGDSALADTSAAGDSLGLQDTTTSRLRPTDTTGAAASPSTGDSSMAGRDSASVLPGDSASLRPDSPSDRLNPTDSAGTGNPTQGP